jgi:hypothetical protein
MNGELSPRDAFRSMPTEELVRELAGILGYTAEKLQRMAFIVAELESRGHRTTAIRNRHLMLQLRRIASGDLLPEVMAHFLGNRGIVTAMARLPLAEQKRLMDTGSVSVLIDGEMRSVALPNLTRESIAIAFGDDHVRTESEQRQAIRDRRPKSSDEPTYRVRPVPDKGGIKVGNSFATVEDVVPALASLNGKLAVINVDDPTTETATVRLTADEKQKLRALEKSRGLPEWHLIREALKACGLI